MTVFISRVIPRLFTQKMKDGMFLIMMHSFFACKKGIFTKYFTDIGRMVLDSHGKYVKPLLSV